MKKQHLALASLVIAVSSAFAGCGSAGPSSNAPSPSGTAEVKVALPDSIAKSGKLTVVTSPAAEPMSYVAPGSTTPVGFDMDLITAVGGKLGLKVEITPEKFPGSIASVAAGRYNVLIGAITDTKEREKTFDFADYLINGTSLVVPAGNPLKLTDNASLCGHTFAILKGSGYVGSVTTQINPTTCANNPIKLLEFPDLSTALLAITSGRADFTFDDSNVAPVLGKSNSSIEIVKGKFVPDAYFGIMSQKGNGVAPAMQAGLKAVIADGTYDALLKKYDQEDNSYKDITLNSAKQ